MQPLYLGFKIGFKKPNGKEEFMSLVRNHIENVFFRKIVDEKSLSFKGENFILSFLHEDQDSEDLEIYRGFIKCTSPENFMFYVNKLEHIFCMMDSEKLFVYGVGVSKVFSYRGMVYGSFSFVSLQILKEYSKVEDVNMYLVQQLKKKRSKIKKLEGRLSKFNQLEEQLTFSNDELADWKVRFSLLARGYDRLSNFLKNLVGPEWRDFVFEDSLGTRKVYYENGDPLGSVKSVIYDGEEIVFTLKILSEDPDVDTESVGIGLGEVVTINEKLVASLKSREEEIKKLKAKIYSYEHN